MQNDVTLLNLGAHFYPETLLSIKSFQLYESSQDCQFTDKL